MAAPKKFLRKDTHKKTKVGMKWRKPKGHQNKKRLHVKGHAAIVKPGYGTEKRHTNTQGQQIIKISSLEELKTINPKTQSALIMRLGAKKKLLIVEEAKKLKITITNLNVKKYEETRKQKLEKKQQTSKTRKEKEAEKKAEIEKKLEDKKKKEAETKTDEESAEEKKKKEKEEKDKILTKAK